MGYLHGICFFKWWKKNYWRNTVHARVCRRAANLADFDMTSTTPESMRGHSCPLTSNISMWTREIKKLQYCLLNVEDWGTADGILRSKSVTTTATWSRWTHLNGTKFTLSHSLTGTDIYLTILRSETHSLVFYPHCSPQTRPVKTN